MNSDENVAYVQKKLGGRVAIYRVSLDGSLKAELAFSRPDVDIDAVGGGRERRVVGVNYVTDRSHYEFFSPKIQDIQNKLENTLPSLPLVAIQDWSADGKTVLVEAKSDTDPGRYYIFNPGVNRLSEIMLKRPELEKLKMAPMQSISYRASDGTMIPAYLTLPVGSLGKNVPAIVLPHTDPVERDVWGFDRVAQFFAQMGFAVLQPNFRGSSGYGDAWSGNNPFQSWKLALSDVLDAGRWLKTQGIADPDKLAIVGSYYGGYAALQAQVMDPDLFKAVIAIGPITSLERYEKDAQQFTDGARMRKYVGSGSGLAEGSPERFAKRFKAPVRIFQGELDRNGSVDGARAMDRALRDAGKDSALVIYPGLEDGLADAHAGADMLRKSATFLHSTFRMDVP